MAGEILQWNISGLKCKESIYYQEKIESLSLIFENINTYIFSIQETHISKKEELPIIMNLYEHMFVYITSYSKDNDPYAGIIVGIRKTEEILLTEDLEQGRLIYVKIKNIASEKITNIFSIYCNPCDPEKQKLLILKMRSRIMLENLENIMILGDFNFVNSIMDRNSQRLNRVDVATQKVWDPFENDFNLQDCFRLTNPSRRLYSYLSKINKKSKSRIDRIYISANLSGKIISSQFIPNRASDHKIIKVKYAMEGDKGPGSWIFNNTLLKDTDYKREIESIIDNSINTGESFQRDSKFFWDFLRQKAISFSKEFSKKKAQILRKDQYNTEKELEYLESLHQEKLSEGIIERIDFLHEKLNSMQRRKTQGLLLRSKIPSFEGCEPSISFLNNLEKRKGEENTIYNLFDESTNSIKSSTEELKDTIFKFYSNLYTKDEVNFNYQTEFHSKIEKKVTLEEKTNLDKDFTESELFDALKSLKDNKSPGMDGLTKEWYMFFWDKIKGPFLKCVEMIKQEGELTEMQKRGPIKITFKKGDRNLLKNYRPITLLNVDLKIITKALALRLSSVLPSLIHPNQTCVPGRHIENNIHIVQNLIDLVNENDGELAIIFIDQEKAFDRMSHSFIIKTLEQFGFGNNFINWVKTICNKTKSFVKVNGYETDEFDIERGVRQGCPLSAFLYVLTAEVLSSHIRKNKKIKGFRYKMKNLEQLEHKVVGYADDLSVAISNITSLDELFITLSNFEKATNAKINIDKTEALWVGKWRNRQDKPHNLKWKNTSAKFLGIHVGNKVGANGSKQLSELNFAEQIEKIKNKTKYWKGKGISLIGRVKVLNIFILSRLWYRTQILSITPNQKCLLDTLLKIFIWDDRKGGRVRKGVLCLEYDKGGLQLVDIECKIKTQRLNRIMHLIKMSDDNIERFLADSLIGRKNRFELNGLSFGLITNLQRINLIKNEYYKKALQVVNSVGLVLKPGNIRTISAEPLFYNQFFLDATDNVFTLTRYKRFMPKLVKELQSTNPSREPLVRDTIQQLRVCINNIEFTNKQNNVYMIQTQNEEHNIEKLSFKDIYLKFLNEKPERREWEARWEHLLNVENIKWQEIWQNIYDKIHNQTVQSSLWETLHLNFWSGYKAGEICKLCRERENDTSHIANNCSVLKEILKAFSLNNKFNNKYDLSFGKSEDSYNNFILFHIKSIVFRARFWITLSKEQCISNLINRAKRKIKEDLESRYHIAMAKGSIQQFSETFKTSMAVGVDTIRLCTINNDYSLHFLI